MDCIMIAVPDDWLQDIYIQLEFRTQKRLSRCCRTWRRLQSTKHVVQTITLHTAGCWLYDKRANRWRALAETAIMTILADVHNVIFSRLTSPKDYLSPLGGLYFLWCDFLKILADFYRPHQYHLIVPNDPDGLYLAAISWRGATFDRLQLRPLKSTPYQMFQYFRVPRDGNDLMAHVTFKFGSALIGFSVVMFGCISRVRDTSTIKDENHKAQKEGKTEEEASNE